MKYLRLTLEPPLEHVPRAFELLAASAHVDRARALALSFSALPGVTGLFHVEGDEEALLSGLGDAPEVGSAEAATAAADGFYLLLSIDFTQVPFMAPVFETFAREQFVVLPPVVYEDAGVNVRLIGGASTISRIVDALPDEIDLDVHEVGEQRFAAGSVPLSDRQREALLAALELGYYDQPRGATHEDVAELLACAPSTASEHLRKAEAKLVRSQFAGDRR